MVAGNQLLGEASAVMKYKLGGHKTKIMTCPVRK